eukprot:4489724-Prymnesium_polylepis.1
MAGTRWPTALRNSTFFVEVGVSRTIVAGQWKLITVGRPEFAAQGGCISVQGSPMQAYIDAIARGDLKPKMSLIYDGYRHHPA